VKFNLLKENASHPLRQSLPHSQSHTVVTHKRRNKHTTLRELCERELKLSPYRVRHHDGIKG
jgi:hypothetical protein